MAGIPGLEGLSGMNFGVAWTVTKFVFYGVMLGVVGYMIYYYLSFNIKVRIHERSSEGFVTVWKRGKFKKDANNPGVFTFTLLGDKRWDQPLDKDFVQTERKGMGRMSRVVEFAEDDQGRLQPIRPVKKNDLFTWTGWDNSSMEFTTAKIREYAERFKKGDFWSKYGALIQMGFLVFLFVGMIVLFRELKGVSESLAAVAASLDHVATSLQPIVNNATGTQVITG